MIKLNPWFTEQVQGWADEILGQPRVLATFDPDISEVSIPYSDVEAAAVIAEKFRNRLTFVSKVESWHMWDGRIHAPAESTAEIKALIEVFARAVADALSFVKEYYEARAAAILAAGGQNAQRDAQREIDTYRKYKFADHRAYRTRVFSSGGVNGLLTALEAKVTVSSDYFNDDRRWLVCRNGVLDLDELKKIGLTEWPTLLPHDPDRPVTRFFDADYDLSCGSPEWYGFLKRSVPDVDDQRFLMKAAGAAFMAVPKLKVIPNLQGPPDSGKSLFTDVLFTLGQGYSVEPDASALQRSSGGTNFEQDRLRNKRFVAISEPDERVPLDDGFVKKVSGGDWTETRTLHAKSSGWYPQCVMFIASNHVVKFNTRDDALLNRVAVVRFPKQFLPGADVPEEIRRDDKLKDKLLAERSGILNWLIWGMKYFLNEGLEVTMSILETRREVQAAGSTALQWIQEFVEEGWLRVLDESESFAAPKSSFIQVNDAYLQYQIWCTQSGENRPLTRKFFSNDIQRRYGSVVISGGRRLPRLQWTEAWEARHNAPSQGGSGHSF